MALYRCEGIVLSARDFGEADRLVTVYTADRGLHRLIAKGARRVRSRLAAGVLPFSRSLFLCWQGRSLDGISQVEVVEGFSALRSDLERLAAATYACELMAAISQEGDHQPRLYPLLVHTLRALAALRPQAVPNGAVLDGLERLLLSYQWKLLALTGFRPALDRCVRCGEPAGNDAAGEIAISSQEGGVLCRHHVAELASVRIVPAAVAGAIIGLIGAPLRAAVSLRLDHREAAALAAVSRDFLHHLLERTPRSRSFLDTLREQPWVYSSIGKEERHG